MNPDPLVAIADVQPPPAVHHTTITESSALPAPTVQQEQVADDVFSPGVARLAATVLGVQTGVAFLQHLAAEAAPAPEEKPQRPPDLLEPEQDK
jgi:hypothetical protein